MTAVGLGPPAGGAAAVSLGPSAAAAVGLGPSAGGAAAGAAAAGLE